ncbi:ATPase, partial [Candidatus Micrarchaeota archaeon]|nr:ATPase [Candidatus Micrarchaeota archaeon]
EGMKFGMVARKIEGKQKLQSAGYAAYDLGDF